MWYNSNNRGWVSPPPPPPEPVVTIKTVTKASETTSGGKNSFKKPLKRNHKMKLKICNTQLQIC